MYHNRVTDQRSIRWVMPQTSPSPKESSFFSTFFGFFDLCGFLVSWPSWVSSLVITFRFLLAALDVEADEENESDSDCDLGGGLVVVDAASALSDGFSSASGNGARPCAGGSRIYIQHTKQHVHRRYLYASHSVLLALRDVCPP